jgi:hypothetical protein
MYACVLESEADFWRGCAGGESITYFCRPTPTSPFANGLWERSQAPDLSRVMQNRGYGLSRMHSPRRLVDKPSLNAPDPFGWHHAHGVDSSETNARWLGEEETPVSAEEKKALVRRRGDAPDNGDLETLDALLAPPSSITTCSPAKSLGALASCRVSQKITALYLSSATPSSTRQSTATW